MDSKHLYLILNLATIAYPLAQSYERRLRFLSNWKALLWAILGPGAVFIFWDILFTRHGVWGFNGDYLLGIELFGLPLEEWLFFVTVPFACLFIWEVLAYYVRKNYLARVERGISWGLICSLVILSLVFHERIYTVTAFLLGAGLILYFSQIKKVSWLGRFYLAWLVCLLPFFLINGALTGLFTDEPVVWYNQKEFMGLRILTIPVEDSIYLMGLLLLNVSIFIRLKQN